jgi:hypothetical protein
MSEEFSWTYFFLGRWMFPFYAGIFIIIGIKIENYRRQKNVEKEIESIINRNISLRDNSGFNRESNSEQIISLTNELRKTEGVKGSGIFRLGSRTIEFENGNLKDILSKNKRILTTVFNDSPQRLVNKINLPGKTLILKQIGKDTILAVSVTNIDFTFNAMTKEK